MTQLAATSMIFQDPNSRQQVRIGASVANGINSVAIGNSARTQQMFGIAILGNAQGTNQISIGNGSGSGAQAGGISIGASAKANGRGSIALGIASGSSSLPQGEMNIGTAVTDYGYNGSNYRKLSGLYDGENDHDAITVGQVNSLLDAINSALGTSIPHIGAGD